VALSRRAQRAYLEDRGDVEPDRSLDHRSRGRTTIRWWSLRRGALDLAVDVAVAALPAGASPWRPSRVTASFIKLRDSLGTTTRLHDLRHFAATQLLAAGLPVTTVAGRLGHTDATTTLSIYAHFVEASDREAAQTIAHVLAKPRVIQEARTSEGDVI